MKSTVRAGASGFTLVEIAIVLVIIGLLLTGVLKGQALVENSRIKSIANDMRAVQAAYNAYLDRYKALPGDEAAATMNARGWAGAAGGNADGVLTITVAQTFSNGGEQAAFWRALRGAGLISGDPGAPANAAGLPLHAGGALLGVVSDPLGVYGQNGVAVCAAGLTPKQAAGVDTLIDGALPADQIGNNLGLIRAAAGAVNPLAPTAGAPAGVPYNEAAANTWTVCMTL